MDVPAVVCENARMAGHTRLKASEHHGERSWQQRLHAVMFVDRTKSGRLFDLFLLGLIVLSVATVMLESVDAVRSAHPRLLRTAEWTFTILFTVEYVLRLGCVKHPLRYATSFFGVVDFLAVVPTYAGLLLLGSHSFLAVRALRLVRVFRILKLGRYVEAGDLIWTAVRAARRKIAVFLMAVASMVVVIGTLMYLIEGAEAGFTSIPRSVYWAIVTLTTVGYGDIAPQTVPGQMLASVVMILGYSIIAVPTGIMSVELGRAHGQFHRMPRVCAACGQSDHDGDAAYCKRCGVALPGNGEPHA